MKTIVYSTKPSPISTNHSKISMIPKATSMIPKLISETPNKVVFMILIKVASMIPK